MQSNFNQTQNTIQQLNNNHSKQISQPLPQVNNSCNKQQSASADETDDDPLLKEGYLPEIYFQLKSDNPADW